MVKLDAKIKRSFLSIGTLMLVFVIGGYYVTIGDDIPKDYELDANAFRILFLSFVAIVLILLAIIVGLTVKSKKKIYDKNVVFRDPSAIFNFKDPQSLIETIVLYQNYTSEPLSKDIYEDGVCNDIVFNMFEKLGWIKAIGNELYVASNENCYFNHLCIEPMESTLKAIELANELNEKGYFETKFQKREEVLTEPAVLNGKVATVYHLDKIISYTKEIKDTMVEAASNFESSSSSMGVLYDDAFASSLEDYAYEMAEGCLYINEALEFCEEKSKEKYLKQDSRSSVDCTTIEVVFFLIVCVSIILLGGIYFLFSPQIFSIRTLALYICILLSICVGVLGTYVHLLRLKVAETLNKRGRAILNKIQGLKNFICNYTQLEKPFTEQIYRVWGEFVFFADLFGLNSALYAIAKENGIDYENEEILDYFQRNSVKDKVFETNRSICYQVPFPYLNDSSWEVAYTHLHKRKLSDKR